MTAEFQGAVLKTAHIRRLKRNKGTGMVVVSYHLSDKFSTDTRENAFVGT